MYRTNSLLSSQKFLILVCTGLLLSQQSKAQLTIQANPGLFTPIPQQQQYSPDKKTFDETILSPALSANIHYHINKVTFTGNNHYNDSQIETAITSILKTENTVFDISRLERQVQEVNLTNPFKLKATVVQPKTLTQNTVDIHFDIYERQPWHLAGTFDNQGRPGIGLYRSSIDLGNENFLGLDDKLEVQYTQAARTNRVATSYTIPVNKHNGKLQVQYQYQHLRYSPTIGANNTGKDHVWYLRFEQPLGKEKAFTPYAYTLFRRLSVGGKTLGIVNGDSWNLGMRYKHHDRYGETFVKAQTTWSNAYWGGNATFWKAETHLKRVLALPKQHKVVLRGSALFSPDSLPPPLEISLGGVYRGRGYSEGLLNGDRGYSFSVEHEWPIPGLSTISPQLAKKVHGVNFVDVGQVWVDSSSTRFNPASSNSANRTLLISTGTGIKGIINQYLQGFCYFGFGLGNRSVIELAGNPSLRVHFGLRSNFLQSGYKTQRKKQIGHLKPAFAITKSHQSKPKQTTHTSSK